MGAPYSEAVLSLASPDLVKHILAVEVVVPAGLPEVELGDVWGVEHLIALLCVLTPPVFLHQHPHARALRVPEHQTTPCILLFVCSTEQCKHEGIQGTVFASPLLPILWFPHILLQMATDPYVILQEDDIGVCPRLWILL